MKKVVSLAATLFLASSHSAFAYFDENDASRLVQDFSETVACQVESVFEGNPLQYKAIQVIEGMDSADGYGATYVVHWIGDYGCSGGNATSVPQFTVVSRSGFASADPVVRTDQEASRDLTINVVTAFYAGDAEGVFHVEGLGYGPDDLQGNPETYTHYKVEVDDIGYMKIVDSYQEGR